jgi:zinc protease
VIEYNRFTLNNGLRVIHHPDPVSTVAVLNILYNVGARDEEEQNTGFAHLFEHLMFGGSLHIPEYDKAVEQAGGSNNAFTNNDFTNYYITVPIENIETAFWLESDRMLQLDFSQKSLDVQRGVVLEEFRQRCFNAPFGKLWHHMRSLLYKKHPYQWPTIGKELAHIENATLEDVETFYYRHYHPANATLCVAGDIGLEETRALCEKWFGSIERVGHVNVNKYAEEPVQTERRFLAEKDLSPNNVC